MVESTGPDPGTPVGEVRLSVGTITGIHGLDGEVKLRLTTDDPERLATIKHVYVGDEAGPRELLGVRFHAGQALIRLAGVTDADAGLALRGQTVRIAGTDARPPGPGEFFLYQIVGLDVFNEAGVNIGRVADVMETGAHDVFVVRPADGGPDVLLPNHPDVVLDIRPTEGRMTVRPLLYAE